jgi:subtilisin family serine protease
MGELMRRVEIRDARALIHPSTSLPPTPQSLRWWRHIDIKLTDYNRQGLEVDLAAPGGDRKSGAIFSTTIKSGYGLSCGSSQAAAHVTGAVAVALQLAPWLSVAQVVRLLKGTARNLGYGESPQGAGLVAVDNLVRKLLGLP